MPLEGVQDWVSLRKHEGTVAPVDDNSWHKAAASHFLKWIKIFIIRIDYSLWNTEKGSVLNSYIFTNFNKLKNLILIDSP